MMQDAIAHIYHVNISWTNKRNERMERNVILCETRKEAAEIIAKRKIPEIRIDADGNPQDSEPMDVKLVTHDLGRTKNHFTLYTSPIQPTRKKTENGLSYLDTALIAMSMQKGRVLETLNAYPERTNTEEEQLRHIKKLTDMTLYAWADEYSKFYPDKEKENLPEYDPVLFFHKKLDKYFKSHYEPRNLTCIYEELHAKEKELNDKIQQMQQNADQKIEQLLKDAETKANTLIADAEAKADATVRESEKKAESVLKKAETEANKFIEASRKECDDYTEENRQNIKETLELITQIKSAHEKIMKETDELLTEIRNTKNETDHTQATDESSAKTIEPTLTDADDIMRIYEGCSDLSEHTTEERQELVAALPDSNDEACYIDAAITAMRQYVQDEGSIRRAYCMLKNELNLDSKTTLAQMLLNTDDKTICMTARRHNFTEVEKLYHESMTEQIDENGGE